MMNSSVSPAEAAQELLARRKARSNLLDFTLYTMPEFQLSWHHGVVAHYLNEWADGRIKRLMLFMPPRHTKSEFVSRRLPAYIFGRNPNASIIAASYGSDLAGRMNRDVQRVIDSEEYKRLFPETTLWGKNIRTVAGGSWLRNSDLFEIVGHKGSYRGAGVGGGITGMGFDYGIIDDPYKDYQEAQSNTVRQTVQDWYESVFYTRRQNENSAILITLTRWHEIDLPGYILEQAANDPTIPQWTVISLPALSEDPVAVYDQRKPGEPLWISRFGLEDMQNTRKTITAYKWSAMYQQRPTVPEGDKIKREWFDTVEAAPVGCEWVRYWDKGGTQDGGTYTAGVLIGKYLLDRERRLYEYYVGDVVRGQWSAHNREAVIKQTAAADQAKYGRVTTYVEQEPGSGGKESAENTVRNLAGYRIKKDRPTGDKDFRMEPFADQAEIRNVKLVKGVWNQAYLNELVTYGSNPPYRDQMDGTSGAFNKLAKSSVARVIQRPGL
jgi:predicted phage terminase large subunit-like protein